MCVYIYINTYLCLHTYPANNTNAPNKNLGINVAIGNPIQYKTKATILHVYPLVDEGNFDISLFINVCLICPYPGSPQNANTIKF